MALKDWKKDAVIEYKWVKKNDSVQIIKEQDEHYSVEIFLWETQDELAKWLNSRLFSSEKMAIKYAKSYMRSH
jgi:hypothetical protein